VLKKKEKVLIGLISQEILSEESQLQLLDVIGFLFLTLLEVLPSRAGDQPVTLKRITSVTPPTGIKIHGVYFLFGRYDGAILLEASSLRAAKDFVLRAATHIYKTETLAALPAEEF